MSARRPGLLAGAGRIPAALRLLRTHRGLWPWCALPLVLNLAFFAVGIAVFAAYYDVLAGGLEQLFWVGDPDAWYGWLWIGPLRALAWLARLLLVGLVIIAVYFLFTVVGGILAAPFLDVLSQRVERLRTGRVTSVEGGGLGAALAAALRSAVEEAKRTAFFVAVLVGVFALGLLPGLQPLSALVAILFSALFLSLDYTGYLLDRRGVPFRARRRWLWENRRAMLGFGGGALATFMVPGLNFLCLPVLVTAGTLLGLDLGPPEPAEDS